MMAETLVKVLKGIGGITDLKDACITRVINYGKNAILHVKGSWSFRNYSNNEGNVFHSVYMYDEGTKNTQVLSTTIQDKRIIWSAVSPDSSKSAFLLQDEEICYINVVHEGEHTFSINLKDLDLHGKVYTDPTLSSFCWRGDSNAIAFVAEKKVPKRSSFIAKKNESTAEGWGEKYAYDDDWGEQMAGQCQSVIVVVDTYSEKVNVLNLKEGVCGGQIVWSPKGSLLGVGFVTQPFKLGLIYCTNRESHLFHIDKDEKYSELTERGIHVQSPRFSPDGSKLVFLRSPVGGPHIRGAQLCVMKWQEKTTSVLVDYIEEKVNTSNGGSFYGLTGASILPLNCWSKNSESVVFSSLNNFAYGTYIINTDTKDIRQVQSDANLLALDVKHDYILASSSSLTEPARICLISINSDLKLEDRVFLSHPIAVPRIATNWQSQWSLIRQSQESNFKIPLPVIYFGPTEAPSGKRKRPLIVWPHGGPHSMIKNEFIPSAAFFVHLGFSILFPNYRGSLGQGEQSIQSLPGHCGTADVQDVYEATIQCLQKFDSVLDKTKVVLYGGSHGGFLVTHLAAQYPDLYKAVSTRNPVIDIASMSATTDIPDWNFTESGSDYRIGQSYNGEDLARMFKMSPLSLVDQVKAPTLLLLGKEDRRVPMSQGLLYHKMLLARNIETKVYIYDDSHALQKTDVEADTLIQTALWYHKHVPDCF